MTAVCNYSLMSPRDAIRYHKLPSQTKAYGDVERRFLQTGQTDNKPTRQSSATSPDIDLLVCSLL